MAPWSSKKPAEAKKDPSLGAPHPNLPPSHAQSGWAAKALHLSDELGGKLNEFTANKWGIESFWPTSGDFPRELEKAARILKAFTLPDADPAGPSPEAKGSTAALRIPPSLIAHARGLAIYSCFRTGWAPVGGGMGSGVVVARLADGSWSAPAAICPTAVGAGMQIGLDVYNAVLVIRSEKALAQFGGHRVALGGEISVAAGPYGGGKGVDKGLSLDTGPEVYAYMHSRGAYFGLEVVGTVFVSRADENAAMYHWPGIKASDILGGKVPVPAEASSLMQTLRAAETGVAQCPNVAVYGPGFGGEGAHGSQHSPSAYDYDTKLVPRTLVGWDASRENAVGSSSTVRPALSHLDVHSPVPRGKGGSPSRTSPGGTRFVPPLPQRGQSPLQADTKTDAPPPYSPSG
ncbi:unnamed protein product [Cutaneotrichosporon oleaginosum]